MVFDPCSSVWSDVSPGTRKSMSTAQWPGVDFSWTVENISQEVVWSIHKQVHTAIVHLGGPIRKIVTEIDGKGFLPEQPIAGDLWIVPAGQAYQSEASGGTVRYAVLEFDPATLPGLMQREINIAPISHQIGHCDTFFHRSTLRLAELTQNGDDLAALAAATLGHALLLHFFAAYPGKDMKVDRGAPGVQFSAQQRKLLSEYLADNLEGPILLAHLAGLVQMTSHELLEAFRYAFGTTPAQYIIQQRLRRARVELLKSNKTIATLAAEIGFSSHAHLTSAFV